MKFSSFNPLSSTTVSTNIYCNGICTGTSTASPNGGIPPYSYSWSNGQTTQTATGLCAGTYTVTITDTNNTSVVDTVYITQPAPLSLSIAGNTVVSPGQGDTLTAIVSGGASTYTFTWNPGGISDSVMIVNPLVTSEYCLMVNDAYNCDDSTCITVTVEQEEVLCGEIFVPTAFSPNNDGQNDVLYVRESCTRDFLFSIYDHWGEKVFEATDPSKGWDGKIAQNTFGSSVFAFHLHATLKNGDVIERKGNITLVR